MSDVRRRHAIRRRQISPALEEKLLPMSNPGEIACDVCGAVGTVQEIRCKLVCRNCGTILQSCADLAASAAAAAAPAARTR